jgi:mono/diheme cytochrome c family protein
MASTRLRSIAVGALTAVAAATLSACGAAGTADANLENGKTLFVSNCGGCHMMAAAGTKGTVGPDLDDAFRMSRDEGFPSSTFQGVVHYWIGNAEQEREPIMPRNIVTGQDAEDVAAYVAVYAGAGAKPGEVAQSPVLPAVASK